MLKYLAHHWLQLNTIIPEPSEIEFVNKMETPIDVAGIKVLLSIIHSIENCIPNPANKIGPLNNLCGSRDKNSKKV